MRVERSKLPLIYLQPTTRNPQLAVYCPLKVGSGQRITQAAGGVLEVSPSPQGRVGTREKGWDEDRIQRRRPLKVGSELEVCSDFASDDGRNRRPLKVGSGHFASCIL